MVLKVTKKERDCTGDKITVSLSLSSWMGLIGVVCTVLYFSIRMDVQTKENTKAIAEFQAFERGVYYAFSDLGINLYKYTEATRGGQQINKELNKIK
jgi:hypothetical protein